MLSIPISDVAQSMGWSTPRYRCEQITHHILTAWKWVPTADHYYFCDDPDCDIVYYGEDDSTILKSQLRTRLGTKDDAGNSRLCYCYGISKEDLRRNHAIKDFVIAQTKAGLCSCDTSNPSGRCCLKNFPMRVI